jgi:hypothetical protein
MRRRILPFSNAIQRLDKIFTGEKWPLILKLLRNVAVLSVETVGRLSQQFRNSKPPHYPLQNMPVTQLFDTLMIDFHEVRQDKSAGADAYKYVLVCIDQFSQFVSMIATKD